MSGMNGQQLKEFYANAFEVWKETQSDDDFMQIIYRGQQRQLALKQVSFVKIQ